MISSPQNYVLNHHHSFLSIRNDKPEQPIKDTDPSPPTTAGLSFYYPPASLKEKSKLSEISPESSKSKDQTDLALSYSAALLATDNESTAVSLFQTALFDILDPKKAQIFLHAPEQSGYTAQFVNGSDTTSMFIAENSLIVSKLNNARDILYFPETTSLSEKLNAEIDPLNKGDIKIFAPIPDSEKLLGFVLLEQKKSNDPYTAKDINLLKTFTTRFSAVYKKATEMSSIQKHVAEMEILNNIAIAINTNKDFDHLLINLYTQIQQLYHINCFSLVMRSKKMDVYQRQFLYKDENIILSTHQPQTLGEDFIEKNAIKTGAITIINNDDTWLIIPLTANSTKIGAISLGHSSDKTVFEHINDKWIQSIANLVTGAIIKADLFQNSQIQAQQLSILNKVSHQLTSTLEPGLLLKSILDGALEILNCSSGILMVIDEKAETLEFKVTAGPIGKLMQGKRLPLGKGIAGEAYQSQKAIINNAVKHETLWLNEIEPEAVSLVENILAIPLNAHNKTIGILELLNKNNNLPFTENDQHVLEGFANQAALAIHNAALHEKTDRALETRLEELYVMQKIDRELNSTRDINIALRLTLQSAITHTHANTGSIGLVDQTFENLKEVWQISSESKNPIYTKSLNLKDFSKILKTFGKPQLINSPDFTNLMALADKFQYHYLIFSQLEGKQHVLLSLHSETSDHIIDQDKEFLTRLMDHAVIAFNNALLYEDLEDAITAKNEFIGFISHELKSPLTVIKGYADIMRKGMAGDINEEQQDYLTTIAHNVRRMSSFITDLADQSHIEAQSLRLVFSSTPVQEAIHEVLQTYQAQIKDKSLNITTHFDQPITDVWCDRLRLIQILSNILSNAIKYTPEGGDVEIGAVQTLNKWDHNGAAEVVHLWIKDTGYGISDEDQKHLFEKFFRGTNPFIQKIPGTGLGLRIAKSLTEMMGGKMWYESTLDKGSTFHFTMPI